MLRETANKNNKPGLAGCLQTVVIVGAITGLLGGCASAPPQPEAAKLQWPAAPQTARIKFVRSISSDTDLHRDTTFSEKIRDFLAGEPPKPNTIVQPLGLAVSADGHRLYVSDFAQAAVFVFDFDSRQFRKIEDLAGPTGIALDADENLYVSEQGRKQVSVFDRQGKPLRSISDTSLERPTGIAIDRQRGRLYVVDTGRTESEQHNVKIFTLDGRRVGTLGKGKGNGPGEFLFPTYITVDKQGNVFVTDTLNSRVQMFSAAGEYKRSFGSRGNGWGMFDKPKGVALDSFGNLYVADSGWSNVQIFNSRGDVLLFFGGRGPIPGMLKNPTAVAIDGNNRIYVADYINHRIEQYQLVNTTAEDSFLEAPDDSKGPEKISQAN